MLLVRRDLRRPVRAHVISISPMAPRRLRPSACPITRRSKKQPKILRISFPHLANDLNRISRRITSFAFAFSGNCGIIVRVEGGEGSRLTIILTSANREAATR